MQALKIALMREPHGFEACIRASVHLCNPSFMH